MRPVLTTTTPKPRKKHRPGPVPYEGPPLAYDQWLPFLPIFQNPNFKKKKKRNKYQNVLTRLQA